MAVLSDIPKVGQYSLIKVPLPMAHNSYPVLGQIVWNTTFAQDDEGYRSGIKLVDISFIELERLLHGN